MNLNGYVHFNGTDDIERCHEFYHDFLGLKLYLEQARCRIYELPGGNLVGFCEHMEVAKKGNMLTFLSDHVDDVYDEFVKAGIEVDGAPRTNEKYNIYHFFTTDPDGHALEIQKFL